MDFVVLVLSLTLLKLPYLLRESLDSPELYLFLSFAVLTPFWIVILNNLIIKPVLRKSGLILISDTVSFFVFLCFVGLILIALLRTYFNEIIDVQRFILWFTLILFSIAVFSVPREEQELYRLCRGVIYALGVFVGFNVVLFLSGVRDPTFVGGVATMLSIVGIEAPRQGFPLIGGINSSGLVAGASLAAGGLLLTSAGAKGSVRLIALSITSFSLYVLLVADSRAALLAALLAIVIIRFTPKPTLRLLPWIVLVMPLLPLLAFKIGALLAGTELGLQLSRGAADWWTLNQRNIIMGAAWRELSDFSLQHMIGFGAFGQVVSGVIGEYIHIFTIEAYHSAHNVVLQYILDIGYLGLVIFLALLFLSLRRLVHFCEYSGQYEWKMLLSFVVYFVLIGITEAVPAIYSRELFMIFLYCTMLSLVSYRNGRTRNNEETLASYF